jgi:hypothetical protein
MRLAPEPTTGVAVEIKEKDMVVGEVFNHWR